jgi:hypothetical protein
MNPTFKDRIINYRLITEKTIERIQLASHNTQTVIDKFGLTKETYAIAVDFHRMKFEDLKLLDLILIEVMNNFEADNIDQSVYEMLDILKTKSTDSIHEAKKELDEILAVNIY